MCIEALEVDPWQLDDVRDHFKTQETWDATVREDSLCLKGVPDWFLKQQQVKLWRDDNDYCNGAELVEWYDGYIKCKAKKV